MKNIVLFFERIKSLPLFKNQEPNLAWRAKEPVRIALSIKNGGVERE
jgi:hypothetical protein